jgi:hypothetical protein
MCKIWHPFFVQRLMRQNGLLRIPLVAQRDIDFLRSTLSSVEKREHRLCELLG